MDEELGSKRETVALIYCILVPVNQLDNSLRSYFEPPDEW